MVLYPIKHLIEDHSTDQAEKAETALYAVSLISVIYIYLFELSMFHWVTIHWSLAIEMVHICNLIPHVCMCVCMYLPSQIFLSGGQAGNSNRQQRLNLVLNRQIFTELIVCIMYVHFFFGVELIKVLKRALW